MKPIQPMFHLSADFACAMIVSQWEFSYPGIKASVVYDFDLTYCAGWEL